MECGKLHLSLEVQGFYTLQKNIKFVTHHPRPDKSVNLEADVHIFSVLGNVFVLSVYGCTFSSKNH